MAVHIGTSGWSYGHWTGVLYPEGLPPVVELIEQKKRLGVAMVAIVHDDEIRQEIADRIVDVTSFAAAA